ncbi:hypothetical protein EsDP_00006756 [Epichloe bromicola]|uniref:Ureidoglycolate hydrolase n=1 Tax=Epichloe bromicola TaxID=79588 RepID=A0ABQ0CYJ7_9HYPO
MATAKAMKMQLGREKMRVTAQPLSQQAFSPFGSVISNPRPDIHPSAFSSAFSSSAAALPPNAVSANQGFAIQYRNVSRVRNLYDGAPSGRAGDPVMSMFVCSARELSRADGDAHDVFTVGVLERHPFTTQTFAPLLSTAQAYLVVVAPSLRLPAPVPVPVPDDAVADGLPGGGLPDLRGLRAYVATGAQAVTYGAGTWHAPMVALGRAGTTLDFVVSQHASGVALEDCQMVEFEGPDGGEAGVEVRVPRAYELGKL